MMVRRLSQIALLASLFGSVGCCTWWEQRCARPVVAQPVYAAQPCCPCTPTNYPVATPAPVPAAAWGPANCACPPSR